MIFLAVSMMAAGLVVRALSLRGLRRAREAGEAREEARFVMMGRVGSAMTFVGLAGVVYFVVASVSR
jgi:hypothetical protein